MTLSDMLKQQEALRQEESLIRRKEESSTGTLVYSCLQAA
jgi:hypothetical protein